LRQSSANLLPGRAHIYHLSPVLMSERENSRLALIFPTKTAPGMSPGFPDTTLDNLLLLGGLPGIQTERSEARFRNAPGAVTLSAAAPCPGA